MEEVLSDVLSFLAVCILVVMIGGLVSAPVALGAWTLRPLDRAAKSRRCPTQFTIADFLCLFFLMQLSMAGVHSSMSYETESGVIWLLDVFGWVSCGLMWWMSVRTLSRAGIRRARHRAVFLALVLPVAFFGSIAAAILAFSACTASTDNRMLYGRSPFALLLAIEIALIIGLYLCGRFTRRMVAAASLSTAEVTPFASEDDGDRGVRGREGDGVRG